MSNNHRSAAQWRTIFSQQKNSGLSVTAFCGQHKVTTSNFYTWRKKLNGTLLPLASGSSDWRAIEPMASSVGSEVPVNPVWDLELTLPGGDVFVFVNRKRTMMKALYYSQGGYCLWAKRLERGHFAKLSNNAVQALTWAQLQCVIAGINWQLRPQKKRL